MKEKMAKRKNRMKKHVFIQILILTRFTSDNISTQNIKNTTMKKNKIMKTKKAN
jgi:phosphorylcholine metabolism protein LicD